MKFSLSIPECRRESRELTPAKTRTNAARNALCIIAINNDGMSFCGNFRGGVVIAIEAGVDRSTIKRYSSGIPHEY